VISRLTGRLLEAELTEVVLDVNGVGYAVTVPMSTFDRLPRLGDSVVLHIHFSVREDAIQLYGFATTQERQLFRRLIEISGIGPRLALNVLSCMPVSTFCRALAAEDIKALSRISGIGKRVAQRLVVELREKVDEIAPGASLPSGGTETAAPQTREAQDAISALETLGYKGDQGRKAVDKVLKDAGDRSVSAQELIRKALQLLNS